MKVNDIFIWDAHACPTLNVDADLSMLYEYKKRGFNFISLNIGFAPQTGKEINRFLNYVISFINKNNSWITLAKTTQEIKYAFKSNKLAIAFDLEGLTPVLNGQITLKHLHQLGVRQVTFVYNTNNDLGGGCQDIDSGLTSLGYEFVRESNELGIVIDCSHVGYRTSLDIMEASTKPVIFSHSNPHTLCKHSRNIYDKQIIACMKTSGVIGVNGISLFLAKNDTSPKNIVAHIDYIYQLVGPDHIGFGFDFVFEHQKTLHLAKKHPEQFPNPEQYSKIKMVPPGMINLIYEEMIKKKYSSTEIKKIMGGNFFRVASNVWRTFEC